MNKTPGKHWRVERDNEDIVWLHLDRVDASVNALSVEVIAELDAELMALSENFPRGLVILSDKKNGFIAGADVKGFVALRDEDEATEFMRGCHTVLDRLESFTFPTISLIHGFCLGGGMELALATRYRIAEDDPRTRLGLPEVMLGIHPGFGGTMRLPRLIGALAALNMMLTGRTIGARAASKIGLIDYAVPQRQMLRAARSIVHNQPRPHRPGKLKQLVEHRLLRPLVAKLLRYQVAKRVSPKHYPAPFALIDLWLKYADEPRKMLAEEARSVARLVIGDTAQNLIRVFFLQEQLKSLGRGRDFKAQHVHVIGAGVMGGDIASWCALQGLQVTLQDQSPERIAPAMKRANDLFRKRLKHPRLIQAALDRLMPDVEGTGVRRADVVVEAIFENTEAKQQLFHDIEPRMKPGALLATNTSSIKLETLCETLPDPSRLVGLHFFNPVAKMQLVEIVKSTQTDPEVANKAAAFACQISRLPLPVKSSPGFLVNRILMPYLLEAVVLESEGVRPEVIDKAAVEFGMPMGPIELADTVGLDICLSVAQILSQSMTTVVPDRLRKLVEAKQLGRKTGRGFYTYKKGKPVKGKLDKNIFTPADLSDRLILSLLNEAVACLREGIVENDDFLDAGIIFGTGFAPFRGGPMRYIQDVGVGNLKERLEALAQHHGERFEPDAGWQQL